MRMSKRIMRATAIALAVACVSGAAWAQLQPRVQPRVPRGAQRAADLEEVITMRVIGSVVVDPAGKVVSHALDTKLEDNLSGLVGKAVAAWTFTPPVVDGKPATVRSGMTITLAGREVNGGFEVRIDNVTFHLPPGGASPTPRVQLTKMHPEPKYPKFNVNGAVTIEIRFTPDGEVADAVATECSLYFAGGSAADKAAACEAMAFNGTSAIRKWRATVSAESTRDPDDLTGILPLQYMGVQGWDKVLKSGKPGQWRRESRTRFTEPAWHAKGRQRVGTSDVADGALRMASSPPLQLHEGAIGKTL